MVVRGEELRESDRAPTGKNRSWLAVMMRGLSVSVRLAREGTLFGEMVNGEAVSGGHPSAGASTQKERGVNPLELLDLLWGEGWGDRDAWCWGGPGRGVYSGHDKQLDPLAPSHSPLAAARGGMDHSP